MQITLQHVNDTILLTTFQGVCSVDDINQTFSDRIFPYCNAHTPQTIHVLYDITELDWTFADFVTYLETTQEGRNNGELPTNIQQYFVGRNHWVDSLRSWFIKNYSDPFQIFSDLETAMAYFNIDLPNVYGNQ